MQKRRILIVDHHPLFRKGLADFINAQPDLIICGEAENPLEAMAAISSVKPDLVVTDLELPGKGGVELIKDIHALYPDVPVIALTMLEGAHIVERVLMAGAKGCLNKSEHSPKLLAAVHHVLKGKIFVAEQVAEELIGRLTSKKSGNGTSPGQLLTDRELHIFQLIGNARTSREIADDLIISIKTVEAHRANIKQKLGLRNAQQLARAAFCWFESQHGSRAME